MALIYIVEDDINIREIEAFSLKNSGYQIRDFGCAADFYAGVQEKLPNLIILDVMLPDEDGLSIVRKLRRHVADKMNMEGDSFMISQQEAFLRNRSR